MVDGVCNRRCIQEALYVVGGPGAVEWLDGWADVLIRSERVFTVEIRDNGVSAAMWIRVDNYSGDIWQDMFAATTWAKLGMLMQLFQITVAYGDKSEGSPQAILLKRK